MGPVGCSFRCVHPSKALVCLQGQGSWWALSLGLTEYSRRSLLLLPSRLRGQMGGSIVAGLRAVLALPRLWHTVIYETFFCSFKWASCFLWGDYGDPASVMDTSTGMLTFNRMERLQQAGMSRETFPGGWRDSWRTWVVGGGVRGWGNSGHVNYRMNNGSFVLASLTERENISNFWDFKFGLFLIPEEELIRTTNN